MPDMGSLRDKATEIEVLSGQLKEMETVQKYAGISGKIDRIEKLANEIKEELEVKE